MKTSISIFAVLIIVCQVSDASSVKRRHYANDGVINMAGPRNCKPKIPYLTTLNQTEFAGVWYLDSSTVSSWFHVICLAHKFTWYPRKFTHDNYHYQGHWRYLLRKDVNIEERGEYRRERERWLLHGCWKQCSFDKGGYMHGWQKSTRIADCNFGSDNATTSENNEPESGVDPCHPHYPVEWDMYVLKTDYNRYAIMWLCDADANKYVLIFSRTKVNLPKKLREELYYFLKQHGFNEKLTETHNAGC